MRTLLALTLFLPVLMLPIKGEASPDCPHLVPVGPDRVNFCFEEKEKVSLENEIKSLGNNVQKFLSKMTANAAQSKNAFKLALRSMHPGVRKAMDKECSKFANKDIIYALSCFQKALEMMEQDTDDLLNIHYMEGVEMNNLLAQLKARKHFSADILEKSCGKVTQEACLKKRLEALQQELIKSHKSMSTSVKSSIHWSVLSARCNELPVKSTCKDLRKWKLSDLIVTDAMQIAYVPYTTAPRKPVPAPVKKPEGETKAPLEDEKKVETAVISADSLDCSVDTKKQLRMKAKDVSLGNLAQALEAQQILYTCRVKAYHSHNPSAQLLSNLGLKIVQLIKSTTSPVNGCQETVKGLDEIIKLLDQNRSTLHSTALDKLITSLQDLKALGCDNFHASVSGGAVHQNLVQDICTWKQEIEDSAAGSTVGFSTILAPCN